MTDSGLWSRQLRAIVAWEWRKAMAGRHWIVPVVLAGLPVLPLAARLLFSALVPPDPGALDRIFAGMFGTYFLRLAVFFSVVAVFLQLFRREVQGRTLHIYLLAPLRGGLVVLGKYLAGIALTGGVFLAATTASYLLLWLPGGGLTAHLLGGPGAGRLARYLVLVLVGVALLGALFLLVGTLFRNPIIPVLAVFGLESAAALLPEPLRALSTTWVLTSLLPVGIRDAAASPAPWTSLAGPLLTIPVLLALAAWRFSRAQVDYPSD